VENVVGVSALMVRWPFETGNWRWVWWWIWELVMKKVIGLWALLGVFRNLKCFGLTKNEKQDIIVRFMSYKVVF
jgi:hypothetical protein